jgi:hypothetical protein
MTRFPTLSPALLTVIVLLSGTAGCSSSGGDPASSPPPEVNGTPAIQHAPAAAEAALNGTYRFTLTPADFEAGGRPSNDALHNAGVQTWVLADGTVRNRLDPSEHEFNHDVGAGPDEAEGTYRVDGNRITFRFPSFNEVTPVEFRALSNGDLQMTAPADLRDQQLRFILTTKTWKKIA